MTALLTYNNHIAHNKQSKHLQLMTGIPTRTFWLSHFLFDLFLYSIYTISVLSIYFIWDRVINDRRIYFANFEHSGECFCFNLFTTV